jgi:hypothetical protein
MTAYHQKQRDPNHLDASLDDFRAPLTPPPTLPPSFVRYPSARSGFAASSQAISDDLPGDEELREAMMDENASDLSSLSAGGYSPPAWRRLENGNRSSGFWKRNDNLLGLGMDGRYGGGSSPMVDYFDDRFRIHDLHGHRDEDDGEDVLEQAIRTRLPTGSLSPEKGRTPEPGPRDEDETLVKMKSLSGSPEKIKREVDEWKREGVLASKSPEPVERDNCKFSPTKPSWARGLC